MTLLPNDERARFERTRWYGSHVPPARDGWYEVVFASATPGVSNLFFAGDGWYRGEDKLVASTFGLNPDDCWRGLTERAALVIALEQIGRLRRRLEMREPRSSSDGIAKRDETIRALDGEIVALRTKCEALANELRGYGERFAFGEVGPAVADAYAKDIRVKLGELGYGARG